jgi:DNA-binding CsgD family transcriptional regulator
MAESRRLRLHELRNLYLLLGECCELGADPLAWRQHVVEKLPALFGGQVGIFTEFEVVGVPFCDPFWVGFPRIHDYGWSTSSDRKPFEERLKVGYPERDPHVTPDLLQKRLKVSHWSGDLGRSTWQRSELFNTWVKHAHLDDGLFAHHLIEPGRMRWFFVNRALGDQPFRERDCRLIALLNVEMARLLGTRLARIGEAGVTDLPRRLREVLICLMRGDAEKQVALRLGVSPNTVHAYIKQLHQRFGVVSRGELLCRCRRFWPILAALENGDGPDAHTKTSAVCPSKPR